MTAEKEGTSPAHRGWQFVEHEPDTPDPHSTMPWLNPSWTAEDWKATQEFDLRVFKNDRG
jgi:hypothetical protein